MTITEALLAEHVVFHNVFDYIERTVPKLETLAEVKSLARLMEGLLRDHSNTEEELVFAPLDHCLEQMGQGDTFHEEHKEIDSSLEAVHQARRLLEARRLLLAAVLASRKHFDHEERIVFPLAEKVLKRETLARLGKSWMEQRKALV